MRGLPYMPLKIEQLKASRTWLVCRRRPELAFYLINLWMRAWGEEPAGSIEDDDDVLAAAADCPPDKWPAIREAALAGWVRCSDGRLYHPTLCEIAAETFEKRTAIEQERAADRARKREKYRRASAGKTANSEKPPPENRISPPEKSQIPPEFALKGREEKGREERKEDASKLAGAEAPPSKPSPIAAVRQALGKVLSPENVEAVLDHRRALRKPLTVRAAELLAGQLARARDGPNAGADAMIANGWVGFKPEWIENRNGRGINGGNGQTGTVAAFRTLRNLFEERAERGGEPLSDHRGPGGREGGGVGTALVAPPSGRGSR